MWTTAHSFLGFPFVTAYQTYGFPFLEFKGIVVDCMGQCPLLLGGLHTDEHCIAWHVFYKADDGEIWQFDIIHIEEETEYDGYFERMADRIVEVMTQEQRDLILQLKFETPEGKDYHGVEYYEAVIADGITTMAEFEKWVTEHRKKDSNYWIP